MVKTHIYDKILLLFRIYVDLLIDLGSGIVNGNTDRIAHGVYLSDLFPMCRLYMRSVVSFL